MIFKISILPIIIATALYASTTSTDGLNKVKVIDFEPIKTNNKYFDEHTFKVKVIKVNETYNRVYFDFDVVQDLPFDTKFRVKVSRSKSENGPWEKVASYAPNICDKKDKYRQYLPDLFIAMTANGNCVQKGHYQTRDSGIFKFYDLIPEKDMRGYYFKSENNVGFSDGTVQLSEVISKSIR